MSTLKPLNPWSYKPWWCQPWSILLVGFSLVTGCWLLTKTLWFTVLAALAIFFWWYYFLVAWPELIRKSQVLNGLATPGEEE